MHISPLIKILFPHQDDIDSVNMLLDILPSLLHCLCTVYPKKYAHGFCFAVLCCGYTLTDFPISIRLTSLALWQSDDCPNASKATLMNMDKYFIWIHYKPLHNHNKAKHNKTVCIFLGIYCNASSSYQQQQVQLPDWYFESTMIILYAVFDKSLLNHVFVGTVMNRPKFVIGESYI